MLFLRTATTVTIQLGPFLDATDRVTPESGLAGTMTVQISKNGAAFAARNSATAITYDSDGFYRVELNATDTNTPGRLTIKSFVAGAVPVTDQAFVYGAVAYDASVGTDNLQVDLVQIDGLATNGNNATLFLRPLHVLNSGGDAIVASSTGSNGSGIATSGNGSGHGMLATGGATGHGTSLVGGATSGAGLRAVGTAGNSSAVQLTGQGSAHGFQATGGATGNGLHCQGGGTSGQGANFLGSTTGSGIQATGGTSGHGFNGIGGSSSGNGLRATAGGGNSNGVAFSGLGSGAGLLATGGATGHGASFNGGATSGSGIRAAGSAGNSDGLTLAGFGAGYGFQSTGGLTGAGGRFIGGATSGMGLRVESPNAEGLYVNAPAGQGAFISGGGGIGVYIQSTETGLHIQGADMGANIRATGADGAGVNIEGGAGTYGVGLNLVGKGDGPGLQASSLTGPGALFMATSGNGVGLELAGFGSGPGLLSTGGATGNGFDAVGGASGKALGDALVDAILVRTGIAEPTSVPTFPLSLDSSLGFLGVLARNKITQTATTQTVRNAADSATIATSTHSDDGTTHTRGPLV